MIFLTNIFSQALFFFVNCLFSWPCFFFKRIKQQASGIAHRESEIGSGIGKQAPGIKGQTSGFGKRVWLTKDRASGTKHRESGSQALGIKDQESGFGHWAWRIQLQEPGIGDQGSVIRHQVITYILGIRHRESKIGDWTSGH